MPYYNNISNYSTIRKGSKRNSGWSGNGPFNYEQNQYNETDEGNDLLALGNKVGGIPRPASRGFTSSYESLRCRERRARHKECWHSNCYDSHNLFDFGSTCTHWTLCEGVLILCSARFGNGIAGNRLWIRCLS